MVQKTALLLALLLCRYSFFAQQTGSFEKTVTLGSEQRILSFHVPTSYNANKSYKLLISLHGLGDNSANFRNTIRSSSTTSSSPMFEAIIVCPDGGNDQSRSFDTPVSDTAIISLAINTALADYNINKNQVYLSGFSLGGRAALHYGLLNWSRFRGMFLWTPAVQTVAEAQNTTSYKYAYQNSKYIPICITVGDTDVGYPGNIFLAYKAMLDAGGIVDYYPVSGMNPAHKIPSQQYQFICMNYANDNSYTTTGTDAGVTTIDNVNPALCNGNVTPGIVIKNFSTQPLTSAKITYQLDNGTLATINWNGNLKRLETKSVVIPAQNLIPGKHILTVYTDNPNNTTDNVKTNDTLRYAFSFGANGTLPLNEGFESNKYPPQGWKLETDYSTYNWRRSVGVGGFTSSTNCAMFGNLVPDVRGKKFLLWTPAYDAKNTTSVTLKFDVAYAQGSDNNGNKYSDSLAVLVSTDCGATFTQVYKKGGATLATSAAVQTGFVPVSASQWRTETINLNNYIGEDNLQIGFKNISGWGNYLYVDNVNLTTTVGIEELETFNSFNITPNPSSGVIELSFFSAKQINGTISVQNAIGQLLYMESLTTIKGNYQQRLDLSNYEKGIYFITLSTNEQKQTKKIVIF